MNEKEKYLVNQLAKSVLWRLGCQELFGKELEGFDEDEIREFIFAKGKEVLLNDRTYHYPNKADTFEAFCNNNIIRGIADDLLTKEMIAVVCEKELRKAYEEVCAETDS